MPADGQEVLFYNALPRLEIDGQEDALAASLLSSMEMTESEGGMSSLELTFKNASQTEGVGNEMPFETSSNTNLSLGREIRLVSGAYHDPQEVFKGQISALELCMDGADVPSLIVLAEDKLQTARLKRRTRLYEETDLGGIVNAVAAECGLTVVAADLSFNLDKEMQTNETDLGFLRRLCARFDVDMQIVGDELHISPRPLVDRGTKTLEYGQTLVKFRAIADLADQVTAVTVAGWDHDSSAAFSKTSGAGVHLGEGVGREGSELLFVHFGERSEHIAEAVVTNQEEAQILADAAHSARARKFVSVEGCATGDPGLRVGTLLEITGVGNRFENTYYVTHAHHHYNKNSGYLTDFRAECAFWGGE